MPTVSYLSASTFFKDMQGCSHKRVWGATPPVAGLLVNVLQVNSVRQRCLLIKLEESPLCWQFWGCASHENFL